MGNNISNKKNYIKINEGKQKELIDELYNSKGNNYNNFPILGIEINYLIDLLNKLINQSKILKTKPNISYVKTTDIVEIIKDYTFKNQISLLEYVYLKNKLNQKSKLDVVKKANVFISHAWSYQIKDIIESLKYFNDNENNKKKNEKIYVWMDIITINQHKLDELSHDFFQQTFHKAIEEIGRVVIILAPWSSPTVLKRSWCIWELYGASIAKDCILDVVVAPSQIESLQKAILMGAARQIALVLGKIDIEKAEAFNHQDQKMILNAVKKIGVDTVQQKAVLPIRDWIINNVIEFINDSDSSNSLNKGEIARRNQVVATFFNQLGDFEQAEKHFQKSYDLYKDIYDETHPFVLLSLSNIASLYRDHEINLDESEKIYKKIIKIYDDDDTQDNHDLDLAYEYNNLGLLYLILKKYELSEQYYKKSYPIFSNLQNYVFIIENLNNSSIALINLKKYDEASENCLKVLELFPKVVNNFHETLKAIPYLILYAISLSKNDKKNSDKYFKNIINLYNQKIPQEDVAESKIYIAEFIIENNFNIENGILFLKQANEEYKKLFGYQDQRYLSSLELIKKYNKNNNTNYNLNNNNLVDDEL